VLEEKKANTKKVSGKKGKGPKKLMKKSPEKPLIGKSAEKCGKGRKS
jgi:hypothetical protein